MALSTSTSTANPELDSMCFKSTSIKEAELFAVQQAQINYICANKKKSTAIVEVAVLIFLLLCLNGAFFWSFIFGLLTH